MMTALQNTAVPARHRFRPWLMPSQLPRQPKGVVAPQPLWLGPTAAFIVWLFVASLFTMSCFGADATGGNPPATQAQTNAAVERMQRLLLELSAGQKIHVGDLSGLGPYAPIIQVATKRLGVLQEQGLLVKQRIADARISEALTLETFRHRSTIQSAESRIQPIFQALDRFRAAADIFYVQTPKDIARSAAPQSFKAGVLTGFTSPSGETREDALGQVEAMRTLAEHCIALLAFLDAITGRYRVQGGHILFRDPNDLQTFHRDVSLIRSDYVVMNDFHRRRLEIVQNAMTKLKKADTNR